MFFVRSDIEESDQSFHSFPMLGDAPISKKNRGKRKHEKKLCAISKKIWKNCLISKKLGGK